MKPYIWGIDVGGTTVKMGLFTSDGEKVDTWEIATDKRDGGKNVLPDIRDAIFSQLENRGISREDVEGVGIDVPGAVLSDGTVNRCINIGWQVFPLEKTFSEMLGGIPVRAANDANAAALGEMWKGAGRGYSNLCMATLGTGLGGGLIIDGKIVPGAFGAAGEIGHIPAFENMEETCGCGKRGCLEQYAAARGPVRLAREEMERSDSPSVLRGREKITAKDVFDAAKAGDEVALAAVDAYARVLGRGLAQVTAVVDPEIIVIGGGVAKAGEILLDPVRKYYRENAFHASRETKIAPAELGNEAGMYGAAKLIVDRGEFLAFPR